MRKKDIVPKWPAEVVNGKMFIKNRQDFDVYVASNYDNKKVLVTVEEEKKQRSKPQNNYYYGVIIPIAADEMGFHPHEAHQEFGRLFLTYEKTDNNGKSISFVRSTSDLTTAEAEDYYAKCREFIASEYDAYIPLPNEADYTGKEGNLTERRQI